MKFAVVEYSSKTGKIWRHTPERPNYVCDPQHEIDPTSFGCYVSALEGEHVPLKGIITGSDESITSSTRIFRKTYKRLFKHWPSYSLNYFEKFDVLLVVHQISDGHEVTAFTKRLKARYPTIFVIGVPTQPYGILQDHWRADTNWLEDFKDFMNSCDVFLTIVSKTRDQWQGMTTTPVAYLPQPYPVHYAQKFLKPRREKEKTIFVAGVTDRENIMLGMAVAAKIQQEMPDFNIQVTNTPGTSLNLQPLKTSRYTISPFEQWEDHLKTLGRMMVVINTDFTLTRGRVQVDCAAVGTPSIGSNSDGQQDLFPKLAALPTTSIEQLAASTLKLITDEPYYHETIAYAQAKLDLYNYKLSAQRIQQLVKEYSRI